jgi:hypothetical protein
VVERLTAAQLGAHFEEVVGCRKEAWMVWAQVSLWTGVPEHCMMCFVMK